MGLAGLRREKMQSGVESFDHYLCQPRLVWRGAQANSTGQKLAIIGPPASGKTFIWTFLKSGGTELVTEHRPTIGADRVASMGATIRTGEDNSIDPQLDLMS